MRSWRSAVVGVVGVMLLAGCGAPKSGASTQSPVSAVVSPSPTQSASAASAPTPSATATPSAAGPLLVIEDFLQNQVRLARLDANDVATVTGRYDGIVSGYVIVANGTSLEAVGRDGKVKLLGRLAGTPNWFGVGTVAVKPDLSQWLYTVTDDTWTSQIHLGTTGGDTVVATIPSPDGNAFYQAFGWNSSGIYMVRQATGLGGAGPFLEYTFRLAKFDLASQRVAEVSPACIAYAVLDDGTAICRSAYTSGQLEVRSPAGSTHVIQVALGTGGGTASAFWKVHVSPDGKRLIAGRNGAKDPTINYQMAVANLTDATAVPLGGFDFYPDTWLPDGRIVADHACVPTEWGGGVCGGSLDGTYIFSSDARSHTLFYRLKTGRVVGSI